MFLSNCDLAEADEYRNTLVSQLGPTMRRVAFGYMSAALNLIFALMLLFWRDKDAEALDRVALTHSEA